MLTTALRYIITNKYFIIISIIVLSYASFFAYYTFAKYKIESLTNNVIELEAENLKKTLYIQNLKIDYEKIIKFKDELAALGEKNNKIILDLKSKLNRDQLNKKSLADLAKSKPKLVENYINKEIVRQLDCLKNITSDGDC